MPTLGQDLEMRRVAAALVAAGVVNVLPFDVAEDQLGNETMPCYFFASLARRKVDVAIRVRLAVPSPALIRWPDDEVIKEGTLEVYVLTSYA